MFKSIGIGYITALTTLSSSIIASSKSDEINEKLLRKQLFASAIKPASSVLEIGFGNGEGANIEYYPHFAETPIFLTALDPDIKESSKPIYTKHYAQDGVTLTNLVKGEAESLPFGNCTFDVVVCTLVFCSLKNPNLAIAEIARVLKHKGKFISVEHILSDNDFLLKNQQLLLSPVQEVIANGCHLNRRTDLLFQNATEQGLFSAVDMKFVTFSSQYPISRQIISTMIK